jgi:hypothetical protein
MLWTPSHRADPPARLIADRHYSRQKPGTEQFVKPGRCFVLRHPRAAVAHTRYCWPDVPDLGMVTFIDPAQVRPIKRRGVETWGYSYLRAGFTALEQRTKAGLLVFQLLPDAMPEPCAPWMWQAA